MSTKHHEDSLGCTRVLGGVGERAAMLVRECDVAVEQCTAGRIVHEGCASCSLQRCGRGEGGGVAETGGNGKRMRAGKSWNRTARHGDAQ